MRRLALLVVIGAAAGCSKGPGGDAGIPGPVGPFGPGFAPFLDSLQPDLLSSASLVEVLGTGFSATPGANQVLVDGVALGVVSASPTRLLASGLPSPSILPEETLLSVEVAGVASNPLPLTLAAAGTSRALAAGGLIDPRSLAPDPTGGLVVFDALGGVLHFFGGTLSQLLPASLFTSARAGGYGPGGLWVADADRIVVVGTSGSVTAKVTGLSAPATALAFDGSGNLFWVDGGSSVRRYATDGSYQPTFATISSGAGITFLAGNLYVTDPAAGTVSKVTLGGAVSSLVTGLSGVRGISNDGTSLYACLSDASGNGAVRISVAGVSSGYAPPHPLPGPGAGGCLLAAGKLWSLSTIDGALEASNGGAWEEEAGELGIEATGAAYAGERLFVALGDRCSSGEGSVVEVLPGGSHLALPGGCGVGTLAAVSTTAGTATALLLADRHAGGVGVERFDLGSGVATTLVSSVTLGAGATALAVASDGSFFVSLDKGTSFPVAHYSSDGQTLLAADVVSPTLSGAARGLAVSGNTLLVALPDRVLTQPLGGGTAAAIVGPSMGFTAISRLAPAPGGGLFFASGSAFSVDAAGNVHLLGSPGAATDVGWTFWNELLVAQPNAFPSARLQ